MVGGRLVIVCSFISFLAKRFQNLGLGLEISTKNNKLGLCFSCNYFFPVSRFALRYVVPIGVRQP